MGTIRKHEGHLDSADIVTGITGWAAASQSSAPVTVQIYINGVLAGETLANLFRPDLLKAKKNGGHHGFSFAMPARHKSASAITVNAVIKESGTELLSSPRETCATKSNIGDAMALIGERGELFLCNDSNQVLRQLCGEAPLSADEIDRYRALLEQRARFFKERKIPYLLVIAPDKEAFYQDRLPVVLREKVAKRFHLAPSVVVRKMIERRRLFPVLDLMRPMRKAARKYRLYRRTDTHWTDYGDYVAYRAILEKIGALLKNRMTPMTLADFDTAEGPFTGDLGLKIKAFHYDGKYMPCRDSAEMRKLSTEIDKRLFPKRDYAATSVEVAEYLQVSDTRDTVVKVTSDDRLTKSIVVFRDSFSTGIEKLLSEHFRRSVYVWKSDLDFSLIEQENPDIVVQVIVSRFFRRLPVQ